MVRDTHARRKCQETPPGSSREIGRLTRPLSERGEFVVDSILLQHLLQSSFSCHPFGVFDLGRWVAEFEGRAASLDGVRTLPVETTSAGLASVAAAFPSHEETGSESETGDAQKSTNDCTCDGPNIRLLGRKLTMGE